MRSYAKQRRPNLKLQAASDAGVGAWGTNASWQQRRQGLLSVSGSEGMGAPIRAASEANFHTIDFHTGAWQHSQKPPGVSRMSMSPLHANDLMPRGMHR
jgi:hypothetical protein